MLEKAPPCSVPAASRRSALQTSLAFDVASDGKRLCVLQSGALHLLCMDGSGPAVPLCSTDGTPVSARSARFASTGETLVSAGDDKTVRVWDVASATCIRSWLHHKKVACVDFSSDGQTVLFADRFGEVYSVPLQPGDTSPSLLLGHLSPVSHLRLAPSGRAVLSADREGHVRSSCYPHAFVIESFYLEHTSPLQVMLPMSEAPLLLTAAAEGREVCLWKFHGGTLVESLSAAALRSRLVADTAEDSQHALVAACECRSQRLLALVFSAEDAVVFGALECSWDATCAGIHSTSSTLTLPLPQEPVAIECSAAHSLCVLTPVSVLIFAPKAAGFEATPSCTLALPPPPQTAGLPAADDEVDDDDAMNDD